ncbi:RHS repeat-associated protein [Winogradskyella wandonensis]|uniref:RHS repeat-associated protein n=1 Tax=Winogradskyella wandonensis TaxID=1442586 RepID=A0A4R1KJT7_9FLAO|nr:RHS repeat-associated protein [Winogradskyella wandonensis]
MPNRNIEGNYRYGYQGEYAEKEEVGSTNSFELRLWDSRIGRWMSTDPAGQFYSSYLGMGNNPINGVDPDGAIFRPIGSKAKKLWSEYKSMIIKTDKGKAIYDAIQNDKSYEVKVVYISELANNDDSWAYDENSKTIYISDGLTANQVENKNKEVGSWNHPNWILAGHELKHAWDHYKLGNKFLSMTRRNQEKSAVKFQNYLYSVFNDDGDFRKGYGPWQFSFFPSDKDFNPKLEKIRLKYEGIKHTIKSGLDNFPSRTFFQIQRVFEKKTYGNDNCGCKK